ncbi:calcium/sodium antiporter [Methylomarinum sp. Ch1-1]|uniref:Calcium/sodium antiporter n=1 Tax=Methylomarinum roseum TaxID=3067653 RepID=A0AAU7NY63_9GAMM|nr:calcium/sodium antiporter [Methylomarinum sp. Ch1-1]MDP4521964.1 calcium/sodium antiporter [Methylomarinum sp. Ch1-1]
MLINFIALAGGLVVLVLAADKFVSGTASIARNLGVSPLLIGLTIVGLGTSAPEILVSAIASLQGNSGLAVGNALGSNVANIGLILGSTALIAPLTFHSTLLKRELPMLTLISIMCFLMAFDGLSERDSMLMFAVLALFIAWLARTAKKDLRKEDVFEQELEAEIPVGMSNLKAWTFFVLGLVGLLLSSRLLVWAAVNIAESFGVSDLVIGLTIVALGTSLPELAASIASVLKKEDDLAIGNVIGSNIYNLLAVYSLPGLIAPGPVAESVLTRDFPVMLGFTFALFLLGYGFNRRGRVNRLEGAVLVAAYGAYQWLIYQEAVAVL